MNKSINPFQQLYFSDDIQSGDSYVELFSNTVLQTAIDPVFQGANVVLCGTQGCGKTMILGLLKPETRIAYYKNGKEFPVNGKARNFISAGINLTRSRITDISQVSLNQGDEIDLREMPNYFADFFNYLVIKDLIASIETVGAHPEVFDSLVNPDFYDAFAVALARQECWFGALDGVRSLKQLKNDVSERVLFYRSWVNGNLKEPTPPEHIRSTKTDIGEPISKAAECLRSSGALSENVPVLIRVDQIEELQRAFGERQKALLLGFRKMINRALSARDSRVNYRAATRRYGWKEGEFQGIWGSDARLEERRDYLLIDMDNRLFIQGENKNSIFSKFALDTFNKRISYFYEDSPKLNKSFAKTVFGKNPSPVERLMQLSSSVDQSRINRALALDSSLDDGEWTEQWRAFLTELYSSGYEGMLDAVLAAAWGRQTGGGRNKTQRRNSPPPIDEKPWKTKVWWRKERLHQAVLQLSTRSQQRYLWWGLDDIIKLSGGNITVFLHICHRIWDEFLKSQSSLPIEKQVNLFEGGTIDRNIQSAGVLFSSNDWFNKLPEEPGGNSRQRVVGKLGAWLNSSMLSDIRMSYPGGNGISVSRDEFDSLVDDSPEVRRLFDELVDYGVLVSSEHSSKSKTKEKRIKFHLHPVLCPRFQLPERKTKEPYYWAVSRLIDLARDGGIHIKTEQKKQKKDTVHSPQFNLDLGDDD